MYNISEIELIVKEAIFSSKSMREAVSKTKLNFKTFRKYAKILNLYDPNPSGKGILKIKTRGKLPLKDILEGKYPQYHTYKLGKRLIKEGYKEHKCECCTLTLWNNRPIPLEVDHIDGDCYNHKYENLRLLCPNCHAQTNTYRGKNKK